MGFSDTLNEIRMSMADTFHIGRRKLMAEKQRIIAGGHKTSGKVTRVKTCWWIKVNTKAARLHALDGAKFPHIIYFTYHVNGTAYHGSACVSYYLRCPNVQEAIPVYYDETHPEAYAVSFGASL